MPDEITVTFSRAEAKGLCLAVEAYTDFLTALRSVAEHPCSCPLSEDGLRPAEVAAAKLAAELLLTSLESV